MEESYKNYATNYNIPTSDGSELPMVTMQNTA